MQQEGDKRPTVLSIDLITAGPDRAGLGLRTRLGIQGWGLGLSVT